MRGLKAGLTAIAMLAGLSACSQGSGAMGPIDVDAKSVEAHVAKLVSETIKSDAKAPADLASLRALLPKEVSVTWASLTLEPATGATLLTDVKVTPAEMPEVGVGIAELRLWDFDVDLLKARMQGQRLNETAKLARRIDAKSISVFGLADMMGSMMAPSFSPYDYPPTVEIPADDPFAAPPADVPAAPPAAVPATPLRFVPKQPLTLGRQTPQTPDNGRPSIRDWPAVTEPEPEFFQEPPVAIDPNGVDPFGPQAPGGMYLQSAAPVVERYDVGYGRLILDDIVLRPFEMPASSQGGMTMSPLGGLEGLIAFSRSIGIDTMAALDLKLDMAIKAGSESMAFNYGIKAMGARGMRGGDLDASFARDMSYGIDLGPDPSAPNVRRQIDFNIGFIALEDLRLDKLYVELAKGAMPSFNMTDLMSLGLWRTENTTMKMAGQQMFSTTETTFDARKFHWFVPTDLQASAKGVTVDFEAIASLAQSMGEFSYMFDDEMQEFLNGVALMKKHGMSKPSMNFAFGWNWNADNGDARLNLALGGDGLIDVEARYEGGFPSYKAVTALMPADPARANMDSLGQLFQQQSNLKLIEVNVSDKGGLTKMFGLAADAGQQMGGIDMGMGPQTMTGDQLRETATQFVQLFAVQASSQFPEVRGLLTPVSSFLQSGGRLRFVMQPGQPLPLSAVPEMAMGALSPSQLIQQLGIRAEHSK
jgi:hypothetical protein